jgi:excinuclease ABC subunit A
MHVVANSDWVIDVGPGAGDEGGEVVISGPAATVAGEPASQTGQYLASHFNEKTPLKDSG